MGVECVQLAEMGEVNFIDAIELRLEALDGSVVFAVNAMQPVNGRVHHYNPLLKLDKWHMSTTTRIDESKDELKDLVTIEHTVGHNHRDEFRETELAASDVNEPEDLVREMCFWLDQPVLEFINVDAHAHIGVDPAEHSPECVHILFFQLKNCGRSREELSAASSYEGRECIAHAHLSSAA